MFFFIFPKINILLGMGNGKWKMEDKNRAVEQ